MFRRPGLRAAVFLLALAVTAFGVARLAGGFHFARQRDAVRRGDLAAAWRAGEAARLWNPWFPHNALLTGIERLVASDLERAGPWLERYHAIFPDKPPGLYHLAVHRLRSGRIEEAAQLAARAAKLAPADPEIQRLVATIAAVRNRNGRPGS